MGGTLLCVDVKPSNNNSLNCFPSLNENVHKVQEIIDKYWSTTIRWKQTTGKADVCLGFVQKSNLYTFPKLWRKLPLMQVLKHVLCLQTCKPILKSLVQWFALLLANVCCPDVGNAGLRQSINQPLKCFMTSLVYKFADRTYNNTIFKHYFA